MNDNDLKNLWKAQAVSTTALETDELISNARRFQRRVSFRNLTEYLAAVLVIMVFIYYIWAFPFTLMRIGSGLIIIGALVVVQQMHLRASSRPLPGAHGSMSCLEFYRAELVRQRDALLAVWLWYVGPFVPGMVVFRWGVETEMDASAPFARGVVANLVIAAVMLGVIGFNFWTARRLQGKIDRLDKDMAEQE